MEDMYINTSNIIYGCVSPTSYQIILFSHSIQGKMDFVLEQFDLKKFFFFKKKENLWKKKVLLRDWNPTGCDPRGPLSPGRSFSDASRGSMAEAVRNVNEPVLSAAAALLQRGKYVPKCVVYVCLNVPGPLLSAAKTTSHQHQISVWAHNINRPPRLSYYYYSQRKNKLLVLYTLLSICLLELCCCWIFFSRCAITGLIFLVRDDRTSPAANASNPLGAVQF